MVLSAEDDLLAAVSSSPSHVLRTFFPPLVTRSQTPSAQVFSTYAVRSYAPTIRATPVGVLRHVDDHRATMMQCKKGLIGSCLRNSRLRNIFTQLLIYHTC